MATAVPIPPRGWALVVIAVAQFMVIMNTSVIGVALPEIQRAVGLSQAGLSGVFNAYVIAFGRLLLLGCRQREPTAIVRDLPLRHHLIPSPLNKVD